MSEKLKISERIWAKLNDDHGVLDDDFECIAHDSEALEAKVEKLEGTLENTLEVLDQFNSRWPEINSLSLKIVKVINQAPPEGGSDETK